MGMSFSGAIRPSASKDFSRYFSLGKTSMSLNALSTPPMQSQDYVDQDT
jgi:hypothetical protein